MGAMFGGALADKLTAPQLAKMFLAHRKAFERISVDVSVPPQLTAADFSRSREARDIVADEAELRCRIAGGHVADALDGYFVPVGVWHKRYSV
jgi:hypothetical protein